MADNKKRNLSKVQGKRTKLIVLTVNPELAKIASAEKLNAKAESAKEMFANYRTKK